MSRVQTMAKRIVRRNIERYRASAFSAVVNQVRNTYDSLVIENRQNKNRDLLREMHRGILATSPLSCNPDARCELHTLTAHHHVCMYLTALKSLLVHFDDVAVVTHDDGSLTREDNALLTAHIDGIRIIPKPDADKAMAPILEGYPRAAALRARVVNALELFDNILLARTEKLINMNSDVLFFAPPEALIDWVVRDSRYITGVFEAEPAEQKAFLKAQGSRFSPHITTALTCFYRSVMDLETVERILEDTRPGWFTAQNLFPLLYEQHEETHRSLYFDEDAYQASGNFDTAPVFRHYWTSTGFFTELQTNDSERIIRSLGKAN